VETDSRTCELANMPTPRAKIEGAQPALLRPFSGICIALQPGWAAASRGRGFPAPPITFVDRPAGARLRESFAAIEPSVEQHHVAFGRNEAVAMTPFVKRPQSLSAARSRRRRSSGVEEPTPWR
jgi:hypothetical protein